MEAKFEMQVINGRLNFSGKGFIWPSTYSFRKRGGNEYDAYNEAFKLKELRREAKFFVLKRSSTRITEDDSRRSGFSDHGIEWDEHYMSESIQGEITMYGEHYAFVYTVFPVRIVDLCDVVGEPIRVSSEREMAQGSDGYWHGSVILEGHTIEGEYPTGHKKIADRLTSDMLEAFTRPGLICKYDRRERFAGVEAEIVKYYSSGEVPKKLSEF